MTELFSNASLQPLWILLVAAGAEYLWRWPAKYHPLTLMSWLGTLMAAKVNRVANPAGQQQLAGLLAMLLLLVPLAIILALALSFAAYPAFFDGLLLFICLRFSYLTGVSSKVQHALISGKKNLASHHLQQLCLRDTANLSPLGISKACCEALILRYCYQYIAVILCFMLFGTTATVCYRLALELHMQWNPKLAKQRYFGALPAKLLGWLQWPATGLTVLSFMLGQRFMGTIKAIGQRNRPRNQANFLLAAGAGALQKQLSGAVMYQGIKRRYSKVGPARLIEPSDIGHTRILLVKSQLVIWCMLILISAARYALEPLW